MKKIIIIAGLLVPVYVGAINITVPSAPSSGYYLISTSTGAYTPRQVGGSSYFPIWDSTGLSSTSSIYQSSGNVGIGTTSPVSLLEVSGNTTSGTLYAYPTIRVNNRSAATASNAELMIEGNNGAVQGRLLADGLGTTAFGLGFSAGTRTSHNFNLVAANAIKQTFNASSGYVGFGTTTPQAQYHFTGPGSTTIRVDADNANTASEDTNPTLILTQDGGLTFGRLGQNGLANAKFSGAIINSTYLEAKAAAPMQFVTGDGTASNESSAGTARITIEADGDIGFGTSTPISGTYQFYRQTGDTEVVLEADPTNTPEDDNPRLRLYQDGRLVSGILGLHGATNQYSGAIGNATFIEAQDNGGAAPLQFVTGGNVGLSGGTARMTILRGGSVGIGTTTPAVLLHINDGNLRVQRSSATSTIEIRGSGNAQNARLHLSEDGASGGTLMFDSTANLLHLMTGTSLESYTPRITMNRDNSRIGFGTTTPASQATFHFQLGADDAFLGISPNSESGRSQVVYYLPTSTLVQGWRTGITGAGGTAFSFFDGTQNSLTMERNGNAYFTNNGNVGIGTTTPSSKLTIGSSARTGVETTGILLGSDQRNIEFVHSVSGSGYGAKIYGIDSGGGVTSLRVATRNNTASWTDRMTILTTNGNVGLGTTTPVSKLQTEQVTGSAILKDISIGGSFQAVGAGHSISFHGVNTASSTVQLIATTDKDGNLGEFVVATASSSALGAIDRFRVDNGGNVGIAYGTSTIPNKLSVNGDANIVGSLGIGTTTPAAKLHVSATTTIWADTAYTPPTSTSTCTTGMSAWDSSYLYQCVSANTWKRATLSAF